MTNRTTRKTTLLIAISFILLFAFVITMSACEKEQQRITGTFEQTTFVYDGTVKTPSFSGTAGITFLTSYEKYEDNRWIVIESEPTTAGRYRVTVRANQEGYLPFTTSQEFTIAKVRPVISELPTAQSIPYNSRLSDSILSGGMTENGIAGTFEWISPSQPVTQSKDYPAQFIPSDNVNYDRVTVQISLTVTPVDVEFDVLPTVSPIIYGQPLSMSTITPGVAMFAGQEIPGTYTWADRDLVPSSASPDGTSAYAVLFTPTNSAVANPVPINVNLVIDKATPSLMVEPTAESITIVSRLASSAIVGGEVMHNDAVVEGTWVWEFGDTVFTRVGVTDPMRVFFKPTESNNFNDLELELAVEITKARALVEAEKLQATDIYYNDFLSQSTFRYNNIETDFLLPSVGNEGVYISGRFEWDLDTANTLRVTKDFNGADLFYNYVFIPNDLTQYDMSYGDVKVNVLRKTIGITDTPIADTIVYGNKLSDSAFINVGIFNCNIPGYEGETIQGTLSWDNASYLPLANDMDQPNAPDEFSVTFTPENINEYSSLTFNLGVIVKRATPTIPIRPTSTAIPYGQTILASEIRGGSGSVDGSFSWQYPNTIVKYANRQQNILFTPTDSNNYESVTYTIEIVLTAVGEWFDLVDRIVVNGVQIENSDNRATFITIDYDKYTAASSLLDDDAKSYIVVPDEIGENYVQMPDGTYRYENPKKVIGIADSGFLNNRDVRDLILPNTVLYIGDNAFEGCRNLSRIKLGTSLLSIGNYAFADCQALIDMNDGVNGYNKMSDSVSTIGMAAFYNCTNLEKLYISNGVNNLGVGILVGCTKLVDNIDNIQMSTSSSSKYYKYKDYILESVEGNNTAIIYAYLGKDNMLVLESMIAGIASFAFSLDTGVDSVIFNSGCYFISDSAFVGSSVRHLYFKRETEINYSDLTFTNANYGLDLKENPIGDINAYVKNATSVFTWATGIGLKVQTWIEEGCFKVDRDGTILGLTCDDEHINLNIPSSIYSSTLQETISIIAIGEYAFSTAEGKNLNPNNQFIQTVFIADGVQKINEYAFGYNESIKSIVLPVTLTEIGEYALYQTSISNLRIPDNVVKIGQSAFDKCANLLQIVFATETTISSAPIFDNDILGDNNNILIFGPKDGNLQDAFEEKGYSYNVGTSFECFNYYIENDQITIRGLKSHAASCDANHQNLVVPRQIDGYTVTGIAERAFYNNASIIAVELPATITNIGYAAFQNCNNVEKFVIDSANENYAIEGAGLIENGNVFHSYLAGLNKSAGSYSSEYTLPSSVTSIMRFAFANANALKTVTLNEGLTDIDYQAFDDSDIIRIVGNNTYSFHTSDENNNGAILKNGTELFRYLTASTSRSFVLPNNVKTIGNYAFADNLYIEHINTMFVDTIGDYAFSRADKLKNIEFNYMIRNIGTNFIEYCYNLVELYFNTGNLILGSNGYYVEPSVNSDLSFTSLHVNAFANSSTSVNVYCPNSKELERKCNDSNKRFITATDKEVYVYVYDSQNREYTISDIKSNYRDDKNTTILSNLVVPSYYNGYPVTKISTNAFNFTLSEKIESIIIPSTIRTLGSGIFQNASKLNRVDFLGDIDQFADNKIFRGLNDNFVVYGEGANLERYCLNNDISYNRENSSSIFVLGDYIDNEDGSVSVNIIDIKSFVDKDRVDNIIIPKMIGNMKVMSIRDSAFRDLTSLAVLFFESDVPMLNSLDPSEYFASGVSPLVYGPNGSSIEEYCEKYNLAFNNKQPSPALNYEIVNDKAVITGFHQHVCTIVQEIHDIIVIPQKIGRYTVAGIKDNAFKDCTRLQTIYITSDIELGDDLFSDTFGGSHLYVYGPSGGIVEKYFNDNYLDNNIIYNNNTDIDSFSYRIESSGVVIEGLSAHNCTSEHDIIVPKDINGYPVVRIEAGAFLSCGTNLRSIYLPSGINLPTEMTDNGLQYQRIVNSTVMVYAPTSNTAVKEYCNYYANPYNFNYINAGDGEQIEGIFKFENVNSSSVRITGLISGGNGQFIFVPERLAGRTVVDISPTTFAFDNLIIMFENVANLSYINALYANLYTQMNFNTTNGNIYYQDEAYFPVGNDSKYVVGEEIQQLDGVEYYVNTIDNNYIAITATNVVDNTNTQMVAPYKIGQYVYDGTSKYEITKDSLYIKGQDYYLYNAANGENLNGKVLYIRINNEYKRVNFGGANSDVYTTTATPREKVTETTYDETVTYYYQTPGRRFRENATVIGFFDNSNSQQFRNYLEEMGVEYSKYEQQGGSGSYVNSIWGEIKSDGSIDNSHLAIKRADSGVIEEIKTVEDSPESYQGITKLMLPSRALGIKGALIKFVDLKEIVVTSGGTILDNIIFSDVSNDQVITNITIYSPSNSQTISNFCNANGYTYNPSSPQFILDVEKEISSGNDGNVTTYKVKGLQNHTSCNNTHNVIIPAEIDGYKVTRIEANAFSNCINLEMVYIAGDGVHIENDALPANCRVYGNPASIGTNDIILNGKKVAGNAAGNLVESKFDYTVIDEYYVQINGIASSISIDSVVEDDTLTIPAYIDNKRVIAIGENAFTSHDDVIKKIIFVSNVTIAGENVFPENVVVYAPNNSQIRQYCNNKNITFNDKTLLYTYKYSDLGNGNIEILSFEEANSNLAQNIIIPAFINGKKVVRIASQAFAGCVNVSEVYFTVDVEMGMNIFNNSLSNLKIYGPIGGNVEAYCEEEGILYNFNEPEHNLDYEVVTATTTSSLAQMGTKYIVINGISNHTCTYAHSLTIPSEIAGLPVLEIAGYAFSSCNNLTSVFIASENIDIPANAFASTNIKIYGKANSINYLEGFANKNYSELSSEFVVEYENGRNTIKGFKHHDCEAVGAHDIVIPEYIGGVRIDQIADYAFVMCENLRNVYFAGNPSLGTNVFNTNNPNIKLYGSEVTSSNNSDVYPKNYANTNKYIFNDVISPSSFRVESYSTEIRRIIGVTEQYTEYNNTLYVPSTIDNRVVILQNGVFANVEFKHIYFEGDIDIIESEIYFNTNIDGLTVYAPQGGQMHAYCLSKNIRFVDNSRESNPFTFTTRPIENGVIITEVTEREGANNSILIVPNSIDGQTVLGIDENAMNNLKSIKKIFINTSISYQKLGNATLDTTVFTTPFHNTETLELMIFGRTANTLLTAYCKAFGVIYNGYVLNTSVLPTAEIFGSDSSEFELEKVNGGLKITGLKNHSCSSSHSLLIPSTIYGLEVVEIGDNAFANCRNMSDVYFLCSDSTVYGDNLFDSSNDNLVVYASNTSNIIIYCQRNGINYNSQRISYVYNNGLITSAEKQLLVSNMSNLIKYDVMEDNTITITGLINHNCAGGHPVVHNLIIPKFIDGKLVTKIAANAFRTCGMLSKVFIESDLTIESNAFSSSTNLNIYGIETVLDPTGTEVDSNIKTYCKTNNIKLNNKIVNSASSTDYVFTYEENADGNITINGLTNYSQTTDFDLIIPEYIDGRRVTDIATGAFATIDTIKAVYFIGFIPMDTLTGVFPATSVIFTPDIFLVNKTLVSNSDNLVFNPNQIIRYDNETYSLKHSTDSIQSFVKIEFGNNVKDASGNTASSFVAGNSYYMGDDNVLLVASHGSDGNVYIKDGNNYIKSADLYDSKATALPDLYFDNNIGNNPFVFEVNEKGNGVQIVGIKECLKNTITSLVIPAKIGNLFVEGISDNVFTGFGEQFTTVYIMSSDINIAENAFENDSPIRVYAPFMSSIEYVYANESILSSYSTVSFASDETEVESFSTGSSQAENNLAGDSLNPSTPTFSFSYNIKNRNEVVITGIVGEAGVGSGDHNLIIPEYIDGMLVVEISDSAFITYENLTKVYFTSNVIVGNNIFSLTNINSLEVFGPNDSYIEEYCNENQITFNGQKPELRFLYEYENTERNTLVITGVDHVCDSYCSQHSLVVPRTINGLIVVGIGDRAFNSIERLTSIKLNENIRFIGDEAFVECEYLTEVYVYSDVILGSNVFNRPKGSMDFISVENINQVNSTLYQYCMDNDINLSYMGANTNIYSTSDKFEVLLVENYAYILGYKNHDCTMEHNLVINKTLNINGSSYQVIRVESDAFTDCANLTTVYFEDNIDIAVNSFNSNVLLLGPSGGSLERYATNNNLNYNKTANINCFDYSVSKHGDSQLRITITGLKSHICSFDHSNIVVPEQVAGIKVYNVNPSFFDQVINNVYFIHDIEVVMGDFNKDINVFGLVDSNIQNYLQEKGKNTFNVDDMNNVFAVESGDGGVVIVGYNSHICRDVHDLIIPKTIDNQDVVGIKEGAFKNCTNIRTVYVQSELRVIGDEAFNKGAVDLKIYSTARDGNNLELYCERYGLSYNDRTYASCFEYDIVEVDGKKQITITGIKNHICNTGHLDIVVPEYIDGLPVTAIGGKTSSKNGAFENNSVVATIVLPEGLISIGENAFANCSSLESIQLPTTLVTIGTQAFMNCRKINYILIPRSVETIEDRAFYNCTELKEVYFEYRKIEIGSDDDGLQLGSNVFDRVSSELRIYLPNNEDFGATPSNPNGFYNYLQEAFNGYSIDGNIIQFNGDGSTTYAVTFVAPERFFESVAINQYEVRLTNYNPLNSNISTVIIPALLGGKRVTVIGDDAFSGRSGITSIVIPGCVRTIGDRAFQGLTGLTYVSIPNSVTSIGAGAFAGCSNMTEAYLSSANATLGDNVFTGTHVGLKVYGPEGAAVGDAIRNMGISYNMRTYVDCFNYSIRLGEDNTSYVTIWGLKSTDHDCGDSSHREVNIPRFIRGVEVKAIGPNAFATTGNNLIEKLTFGSQITEIDQNAFSNARALKEIIIDPVREYTGQNQGNIIESRFEFDQESLALLRRGSRIDILDAEGNIVGYEYEMTLYTCLYAEKDEIEIPRNVVAIEPNSLTNLTNVKKLILNDELLSIGEGAMAGLINLETLILGKNLATIGDGALGSCPKLTNIDTITNLNESFYSERVELPDGTFTLSLYNTRFINGVPTRGTTLVMYLASSTAKVLTIPKGVLSIRGGAFDGVNDDINNPKLIAIVAEADIPYPEAGYTDGSSVVKGAFDGLNKLVTIYCTESNLLEYFCSKNDERFILVNPSTCFEYTINNDNTVTINGMHSDRNCDFNHENVIIPPYIESMPVISISASAFAGHEQIRNILLPATLTTIGDNAFNNVRNLISVVIQSRLTYVGKNAFANCNSLEEVYFDQDIASFSALGENIITGTNNAVVYGPYGQTPETRSNLQNAISTYEYTYINKDRASCFEVVQVTNGVEIIGIKNHLCVNGHTTIVIPESITIGSADITVKSIAADAFRDNKYALRYEIPCTIENIGAGAFMGNERLKGIDFVCVCNQPVCSNKYAYDPEEGILYEYLPVTGTNEVLLKIHSYLNNNIVSSLILNDDVVEIGDRAFDSCSNINMLYLNTDVILGRDVFVNIDHIFSIYMYSTEGVGSYNYVISNPVELNIYKYLQTEDLSNGSTKIVGFDMVAYNVDNHSTSLLNLVIPETILVNGVSKKVTAIGAQAFINMQFTTVVIPSTVNTIESEAFANTGVRYINFLGDVMSIADDAFTNIDGMYAYAPSGSNIEKFFSLNNKIIPYVESNLVNKEVTNAAGVGITVNQYQDYRTSLNYSDPETANVKVMKMVGGVAHFNIDQHELLETLIIPYVGYDIQFDPSSGSFNATNPQNIEVIGSIPENPNNPNPVVAVHTLVIPSTITKIEAGAFSTWNRLQTVVFEGNPEIEDGAFPVNKNMTIRYPSGSTNVKEYLDKQYASQFVAAEYAENIKFTRWSSKDIFQMSYEYVIENGVMRSIGVITGITDKNEAHIVIPKYIDGVRITKIGERAFEYLNNLVSVVIPDSINYIGEQAFIECVNLREIVIPSSVTYLGFQAFNGCINLINLEFDSDVLSIGSQLFGDERSQVRVFGPQQVSNSEGELVNSNIYNMCTAWGVQFNVGSPISAFVTRTINNQVTISGIKEGFEGRLITIPQYIKGNKVTVLANSVFANMNNVYNVEIPSTVETIGEYAFANCANLTTISIPSSVTSIGKGAFLNCARISSITIPSGIGLILEETFKGCSNLTNVVFDNERLERIGESAFEDCEMLSRINLPTSVTLISKSAFKNSALREIVLPARLQKIETEAFMNATSLRVIEGANIMNASGLIIEPGAFKGINAMSTFALPEGSKYLFDLGLYLYEIDAEENKKFMHTVFNNTDQKISLDDTVTGIRKFAFYNLRVPELEIMGNIESIEEGAFVGLNNLSKIEIVGANTNYIVRNGILLEIIDENSRTIITYAQANEDYVYSSFNNKEPGSAINIKLDNVTKVGDYAFAFNTTLRNIVITTPEAGSFSIGEYAFYNSTNIESVTLGDGITNIGDYAFSGLQKLLMVYHDDADGTIGDFGDNVYDNSPSDFILYGPFVEGDMFDKLIAEGINVKKCTSVLAFALQLTNDGYIITDILQDTVDLVNWNDIILPPYIDGIRIIAINDRAFANDAKGNLNNVRSIYIPSTVQRIGAYAFQNLFSLQEVYIDSNAIIGTVNNGTVVQKLFDGINNTIKIFSYPNSDIENYVIISNQLAQDPSNNINYTLLFNEETSIYCYEYRTVRTGEIQIVGFTDHVCVSNHSVVNIPTSIDGKTVVEIADDAFAYNNEITRVIIPSTVKRIGSFAFANCRMLEQINVASGVETIGNYAFEFTSSLLKLYFEVDAKNVGVGIFNEMSPAVNVYVPSTGKLKDAADQALDPAQIKVITPTSDFAYEENVTYIDGTMVTLNEYIITEYNGLANEVFIPDYIDGMKVVGIAASAFRGNTTIKTLSLGEFIRTIGMGAFDSCTNLTGVTLNDELDLIDISAFSGCERLTWMVIPNSVQSIGVNAFANCGTLSTGFDLTIEGNNTALGRYNDLMIVDNSSTVRVQASSVYTNYFKDTSVKFNGGAAGGNIAGVYPNVIFKTELVDDGIRITGIKNSELLGEMLAIPTSINGKSVTEIGNYAFANLREVQYCVLPDTVKVISSFAFYNCVSLKAIYLPENIERIGKYAFGNCNSLSDNLKYKTDDSGNKIAPRYTDINGAILPTNSNESKYEMYLAEDFELTDNVFTIKSDALDIDQFAFAYCNSIARFDLDVTTLTIAEGAFVGTYGIEVLNLKSSTKYKFENKILYELIQSSTTEYSLLAYMNHDVTSVMIPKFVQVVRKYSFMDVSLNSIYVARHIAAAGNTTDMAFNEDWTNMTNATLYYPGATGLNNISLLECEQYNDKLVYSIIDRDKKNAEVIGFNDALAAFPDNGVIRVPEFYIEDDIIYTVVGVGNGAFSKPNNDGHGIADSGPAVQYHLLQELYLPDSITYINDNAFEGDATGQYVSKLRYISFGSGLVHIGNNAFKNCGALSSLYLPAKLAHIGESAFAGCNGLEEITVSATNGSYNFDRGILYNRNKSRVIIAINSLIEANLVLSETVQFIDQNAFNGLTKIETITINGRIEGIGNGAFKNASSIKEIVFLADVLSSDCVAKDAFEDLGKTLIYGGSELQEFMMNDQSVSAGYVNLIDYSKLLKVETANGSGWRIVGYNEDSNNTIKSVGIPAYIEGLPVLEIGASAFAGLFDLRFISLPYTLTTIGANAFASCFSLETINIPASVSTIGNYAFSYCSKLKYVIFEGTNENIRAIKGDANAFNRDTIGFANDVTNLSGNGGVLTNVQMHVIQHTSINIGGVNVQIVATKDDIGNYRASLSGTFDADAKVIILPMYVSYIDHTTISTDDITIYNSSVYHQKGSDIYINSVITDENGNNVVVDMLWLYKGTIDTTIRLNAEYISANAIAKLTDVVTVQIGANVKYIEAGAFKTLTNLTRFEVDGSNSNYVTSSNNGALYRIIDENSLELIAIAASASVSGDTIDANNNMFLTMNINDKYPVAIADYAFANLNDITNVTIPRNIVTLSNKSLANSNIRTITFSTNMTVSSEFFKNINVDYTKLTYGTDNEIDLNDVAVINVVSGVAYTLSQGI